MLTPMRQNRKAVIRLGGLANQLRSAVHGASEQGRIERIPADSERRFLKFPSFVHRAEENIGLSDRVRAQIQEFGQHAQPFQDDNRFRGKELPTHFVPRKARFLKNSYVRALLQRTEGG